MSETEPLWRENEDQQRENRSQCGCKEGSGHTCSPPFFDARIT